jgi:hypothetical protein
MILAVHMIPVRLKCHRTVDDGELIDTMDKDADAVTSSMWYNVTRTRSRNKTIWPITIRVKRSLSLSTRINDK